MEKIGCKKYGDAIELSAVADYYQEDNVCRSCLHFDTCREANEIADGMDKR
ncbi:MAG: hypothetical protein V3T96_04345 [Thermodesulfobacteriota bacterium]